jgi:hypothetical protein
MQKGDRMDERIIEQEGQNGKRKRWGIEIFFFGIVIFILDNCNQKSKRP